MRLLHLRRAAPVVALLGFAAAPSLAAIPAALLPVQDRAGDAAAAAALAGAMRARLAEEHDLATQEVLRDALRDRRLRNVEAVPPAALADLAAAVGVDRLFALTLHHALGEPTPALVASCRAYDGATGEVAAAAFAGGSGLDGRTLLGLGVAATFDEVAARLARELVAQLARNGGRSGAGGGRRSGGKWLAAPVAILPLGTIAEGGGAAEAEAATEALRASLADLGVATLSANLVAETLRRERVLAWGELALPAREALAAAGAATVLTGALESWETRGDGLEPEPVAGLSLRLLDAAGGRILWTGAAEGRGWDRSLPFRLGRDYDHGTLISRLTDRLVTRLVDGDGRVEPDTTRSLR